MMGVTRWVQMGLWFWVVLVMAGDVLGASVREIEKKAEKLYRQGEYAQSLSIYQGLLSRYPQSADILYNMGNIYYKQRQLGKAWVLYSRAEKYHPRDSQLRYNMALVSEERVDQAEFSGTFTRRVFSAVSRLALVEWALLAVLSGFLVMGGVVRWIFGRRAEWVVNALLVGVVCHVFIVVFLGITYYQTHYLDRGALVAKKSAVKSGPDSELETMFYIHDGTEFVIVKTLDGWVEIKLGNGLSGWIRSEAYWKI